MNETRIIVCHGATDVYSVRPAGYELYHERPVAILENDKVVWRLDDSVNGAIDSFLASDKSRQWLYSPLTCDDIKVQYSMGRLEIYMRLNPVRYWNFATVKLAGDQWCVRCYQPRQDVPYEVLYTFELEEAIRLAKTWIAMSLSEV